MKDEDKIWFDYAVMKLELGYDYTPEVSSESGLPTYEQALEAGLQEALKLIQL